MISHPLHVVCLRGGRWAVDMVNVHHLYCQLPTCVQVMTDEYLGRKRRERGRDGGLPVIMYWMLTPYLTECSRSQQFALCPVWRSSNCWYCTKPTIDKHRQYTSLPLTFIWDVEFFQVAEGEVCVTHPLHHRVWGGMDVGRVIVVHVTLSMANFRVIQRICTIHWGRDGEVPLYCMWLFLWPTLGSFRGYVRYTGEGMERCHYIVCANFYKIIHVYHTFVQETGVF